MLSKYRTALITGGSSGIGKELAFRLAGKGLELYLVSENNEQLAQTRAMILNKFPNSRVKTLCCDLSENDAVEELCQEIDDMESNIDLVINNAGFATWGNLLETDEQKEKSMMSLMINGTYTLTRFFLAKMKKDDHGCIVNTSSVAAFQPNPTLATYGASKSWIYYWTRSINEELSTLGSRVQCIVVCPTPVRTNFQKVAAMDNSRLFDSPFTVDPEDVAEGIISAINYNREKIIPVKWLEITQKVTQRFPESWRIWIGKKLLEPKND